MAPMDPPPPATGSGVRTEDVRRRHVLVKALAVGAAAGLMSGLFRLALQAMEEDRVRWVDRRGGPEGLMAALALGMGTGAIAVWLVRRFAPEAAGSGIPGLKSVLLGHETLRWRRLIPVKFLSGALGIGGGFALGREGPTIQMGGAAGLMVSSFFRVSHGEGERKALITAGAGAGLAAAFNAPLSGMVFVLEELQVALTPVVFVAAFLAAVAAAIVARLLAGGAPVFAIGRMASPGLEALPGALVLGGLAGLAGCGFNWSLLKSMDLFDRLQRCPPALVGALVGGAMGLAGWIVPGLAGTGTGIVQQALEGRIAAEAMLLLLGARFLMTMASYGCGPAGGIFIPLFVLGSLGGLSLGAAGHALLPALFPRPEVFAVLGMGALFTGIVRAPLTGLVLMVELTGAYGFMLPLLVSCFAAYGVAEMLGSTPVYEALRIRAEARRRPAPALAKPSPDAAP